MKIYTYRAPCGVKQKKSYPRKLVRQGKHIRVCERGGMIIVVSADMLCTYVGVSACSMADKFDWEIGYKLAAARQTVARAKAMLRPFDSTDRVSVSVCAPAVAWNDPWFINTISQIISNTRKGMVVWK